MRSRSALLITLALTLLAAPLAAEAQTAGKVYRLAIVATTLPVAEYRADPAPRAFFVELRRLGYVEGQNLVVEGRSALGRPERFPEIAAEVVRLNPDVILAGSNRVLRAVKATTATIPIVPSLSFPVEYGLVTSLARPGANLTGLTDDAGPVIYAKRSTSSKKPAARVGGGRQRAARPRPSPPRRTGRRPARSALVGSACRALESRHPGNAPAGLRAGPGRGAGNSFGPPSRSRRW
jgi:hypothetical protein